MLLELYYVKNLEELARYIEDGEVLQGSNLSNTLVTNPNGFTDDSNVDLKLHAAQCEVEMILASRGFKISDVRLSGNTFINNAVAVVCWWNMEINTDREIIRDKYREIVKRLKELNLILKPDGTAIYPVTTSEDLDPVKKRGRPFYTNRPLRISR